MKRISHLVILDVFEKEAFLFKIFKYSYSVFQRGLKWLATCVVEVGDTSVIYIPMYMVSGQHHQRLSMFSDFRLLLTILAIGRHEGPRKEILL